MRVYGIVISPVIILLISLTGCDSKGSEAISNMFASVPEASGGVVNGFRQLPISIAGGDSANFIIYRGDYVKFIITDSQKPVTPYTLEIPALQVKEVLRSGSKNPFFKMKAVGRYDFKLGNTVGTLDVVKYDQEKYREVKGREAFELVYEKKAYLLDVRTPDEFARGRIENAELMPLQDLQRRVGELSILKDEPVLVYCATGNRSTTAAKILIDAGFNEVYNMTNGIVGWASEGNLVKFD